MMLITKIEPIGSKRYLIYIDYEYKFLLYNTDIKRYKIVEDEEIAEQTYHNIIEDTVYRRAKQKALAILKYMDRTEHELRGKLAEAFYTEDIINRTMEYINSYHYLDDERYLQNYINFKGKSKSRRQLQEELYRKGLSKAMIEKAFDNCNYDDTISLQKHINKKVKNRIELTIEEKQKIIQSLCRKGYRYDDIVRYLP